MGNNRCPRCACPWCNRPGVIAIPVMNRGGGNAYLCDYHGNGGLDLYSAENPLWWGEEHAHGLTYSAERELAYATRRGLIEMAINGHRITHDCTVYCEMKSPIYQSLSAPVAYGRTLDMLLASGDIKIDSSCGMHFHVGRKQDPQWSADSVNPPRWEPINADTMEIIRSNYINLFQPLYRYWIDREEESTEVFGRDFGTWAQTFGMQDGVITSSEGALEHRLAINVQHDATIEFRRPYYVNSEQYRRCMYGCSAVVDTLTRALVPMMQSVRLTWYNPVIVNDRWARKTGSQLVKAWRRGIEK